jgi:Flp pilus assembly protein TadD
MNTSLNGGLNGELSGTAAGDGAAGDLTLKSQHRRKMQLAHEAGLLHKAGRTEDLERCLRELLEIDPKNAQALYNLGIIAFRRDERATAER